jgi:hypothetical protein
MKMHSLYCICLLLFLGCETPQTKNLNNDLTFLEMIPPPPPNYSPPAPAPTFIPSFEHLAQIQINEIPHPFNLNGHMPCAVWVNGRRLDITPTQAQNLANAVNLSSQPKISPSKLHAGIGWIEALPTIK